MSIRKTGLTITVEPELIDTLKTIAVERTEGNISRLIREIVKKYLKENSGSINND